jgi:hypothetical protein
MTTRLALAALATAAALALAACGSACQDLGDRICSCQPAGTFRDSCRSSVRTVLGSSYGQTTQADQTKCQDLLKTCPDFEAHGDQCRVLSTQAGMEDCGLAYDGGTP